MTLVAHSNTYVRFYADVYNAPAEGVPGATAVLQTCQMAPNCQQPHRPRWVPFTPPDLTEPGLPDPAPVSAAERLSDNNVFGFTLPDDWTIGTVDLEAQVLPPDDPRYVQCTTPTCPTDDTIWLNNVTFTATPPVYLTGCAGSSTG